MLFNSLDFLVLVLATFALYYAPPTRRWQVSILIVASFVFYAYSQPALLTLLILSCTINAVSSFGIFKAGNVTAMRLWAILGVGVNLSLLVFFKYSKLIYSSLGGDLTRIDGFGAFLITIPLPIGISFFTFQGISLIIDTFRWKATGDAMPFFAKSFLRHFHNTTFFKAFFPQLIAGPIVKARQFLPQISRKSFGGIHWENAFRFLVTGYFLKMVIADNLKDLTFWIEFPYFESMSSLSLLLMLFGYSMQIFADFAGYSLIAMGLAELFGYHLPVNFNFPYISRSFSEFWTRWHISLSTWLREYLYIPLGGNRKGEARTYFNLFAVMFLGGLWHGATWSYAIWGTFHGIVLALEKPFLSGKDKPARHWTISLLRILLVFGLVTLAWLLFKLPDFRHAVSYVAAIAANTRLAPEKTMLLLLALYSLPVLAYHAQYLFFKYHPDSGLRKLKPIGYGIMLFLLAVNSGAGGAFIYFQF